MIGPGRKKKPSTVNEIQVTLKLREQPEIESSDFFMNPEVFGGKMDNMTDIPFLGFDEARSVSYLVFWKYMTYRKMECSTSRLTFSNPEVTHDHVLQTRAC